MFKKMLIVTLASVLVIAVAASIFNTVAAKSQTQISTPTTAPAAGQSISNNSGQGNQFHGENGQGNLDANGAGTPAPQNGLTEWVTFSGVVSDYVAPKFALLTQDGQSIPAELGNSNYVSGLGLALQNGDAVTVTGFWDTNGGLALKSLTLDNTGQTFAFRDDLGRPLWAGGQGHNRP